MENKENAYLTCGCAEQCYSNHCISELYNTASKTNEPEDWDNWRRITVMGALIDCFNMDCLMRKDYKQAMENLLIKN